MRLYSQLTGSTYISGFHSDIPEDAKPITEENYLEVIANPKAGKVRSHDANGLPILIDPPPATGDELAAAERKWRDGQVSDTEWLVTRHRDEQDMQLSTTLTPEQFSELLAYRQGLRDWPQSELFPGIEHRPQPPTWLADLTQ
ncbi:phage tail protein [Pseudomonas sp. FFUP_PS_473]|uniref:phage tail assembly chaperone n=1 Tax=Pseudomonas sp. FFUP_PS_473 TaxID=2060418 RepID=UPI000C79709F|nr:phage tail assembly chaperone [Pseudomonas sp. FFUP_PS_473]PLP87602.1 phage tail protein [Pseudomonas sp. FFUP_PS_473]